MTTHSSGGFLSSGRNEFVRPLLRIKNLRVCCLLEPAIKTFSLSLVWAGDGCELHCDRCHRCHLVATYDGASSLASCCDIGQIRDLILYFHVPSDHHKKNASSFAPAFKAKDAVSEKPIQCRKTNIGYVLLHARVISFDLVRPFGGQRLTLLIFAQLVVSESRYSLE